MIFEFVVGHTRIEYMVNIDVDADTESFDFIIRGPTGFLANATLINKRLSQVDRTHSYRLIAQNPVLWDGFTFYIDCSVYFYPSGTIYAWTIRTDDLLPYAVYDAIEVWRDADRLIMIGTLVAHRQAIHEEYKREIRDRARRQATNMHVNAQLIIGYLDELESDIETGNVLDASKLKCKTNSN